MTNLDNELLEKLETELTKRGYSLPHPLPPITHACAHCKKPFVRKRKNHKYCSDSCRVLAYRDRQKNG